MAAWVSVVLLHLLPVLPAFLHAGLCILFLVLFLRGCVSFLEGGASSRAVKELCRARDATSETAEAPVPGISSNA